MNNEQLTSFLRQGLFALSGYLGVEGAIGSEWTNLVIGVIIFAATSAWAIWTRSDKQIVATAAAKVPVSATAQAEVGIETPVKPKA